jgi:hypothetical protein
VHTAGPLVPEPSSLKFQNTIEKLKRYKLTGVSQISAELLQAGGNTSRSEVHKLINSIWIKEECCSSVNVFQCR